MIPDKNIESLLEEYFRGTLSQEEGKLVDEWICESAEHRALAAQYCHLEQILSGLEAPDSNETDAALRKMHSRMRKASWHNTFVHVHRFAAFMAIPLLIATLFLSIHNSKQPDIPDIVVKSVTGMTASTQLPDGSKVWLNSNSTLSFPASFDGTREVYLDGQAFFSVTKQQGTAFIVHAKGTAVEVLGTEFDVEAYPTDELVRTTLLSGSVSFTVPSGESGNYKYMIKPGERYSWDASSGRTVRSTINPATASSWKDGNIVLENTSLEEALRQIGNRFNVEFLVKNEALLSQTYTGTFTGQRLEVVLEHFKRATKISFDTQITGTDPQNVSGRQKILVY